jgi:ketosteroid isomerase-like protein
MTRFFEEYQAMTAMERTIETVKEAYRKWGEAKEQSYEQWFALLADNIEWKSLADGEKGMEFTGNCCSKEQVRAYFKGLAQDWEMQSYVAHDFIAQDPWVVMRGECTWKYRKTGKVVRTPKADFLRFQDGKVVEFMEFFDTAKALAATQP